MSRRSSHLVRDAAQLRANLLRRRPLRRRRGRAHRGRTRSPSRSNAVCPSSTSRSANSRCGSRAVGARSSGACGVYKRRGDPPDVRRTVSSADVTSVPAPRRTACVQIPLGVVEPAVLKAHEAQALHGADVVGLETQHGLPLVEGAGRSRADRWRCVRRDRAPRSFRGCRSRPRSAIFSATSIWPWRRSASPSCRNTRLDGSRASSSLQRRISSAMRVLLEDVLECLEREERLTHAAASFPSARVGGNAPSCARAVARSPIRAAAERQIEVHGGDRADPPAARDGAPRPPVRALRRRVSVTRRREASVAAAIAISRPVVRIG